MRCGRFAAVRGVGATDRPGDFAAEAAAPTVDAGPAGPLRRVSLALSEQRTLPGSTTLAPGRPAAHLGKFGDRVRGDSRDRPQDHGFVWENGQITDLGTLGGGSSIALDVNQQGRIVGVAATGNGRLHAVLWTR